jgi:hypothetical protein
MHQIFQLLPTNTYSYTVHAFYFWTVDTEKRRLHTLALEWLHCINIPNVHQYNLIICLLNIIANNVLNVMYKNIVRMLNNTKLNYRLTLKRYKVMI